MSLLLATFLSSYTLSIFLRKLNTFSERPVTLCAPLIFNIIFVYDNNDHCLRHLPLLLFITQWSQLRLEDITSFDYSTHLFIHLITQNMLSSGHGYRLHLLYFRILSTYFLFTFTLLLFAYTVSSPDSQTNHRRLKTDYKVDAVGWSTCDSRRESCKGRG